jgi:hypothetical protein
LWEYWDWFKVAGAVVLKENLVLDDGTLVLWKLLTYTPCSGSSDPGQQQSIKGLYIY